MKNLPHKKLPSKFSPSTMRQRYHSGRGIWPESKWKICRRSHLKDKRSKYEHLFSQDYNWTPQSTDKGKNIQSFPNQKRTSEPQHGWRLGLRNGQHICHQVVPHRGYMIQMREKSIEGSISQPPTLLEKNISPITHQTLNKLRKERKLCI